MIVAAVSDRLIHEQVEQIQMIDGAVSLQVKAFGKDGVRLCWSRCDNIRGPVVAEVQLCQDWVQAAEDTNPENSSGVIVVRELPQGGCPRNSLWRIRTGIEVSAANAALRVPGSNRARQSARQSSQQTLADHDIEWAFNILQWYGTVLIDSRQDATDRLAESLVCPGAAALAAVPFRDDALVIGSLSDEAMVVLSGRVNKCIYTIGSAAVPGLLAEFPCLCGEPSSKRRVLPNVVCSRLVVGHQGHAVTLPEWSQTLGIVGVVNLASNRVPSALAAIANPQHYHEVLHQDGDPLWDVAGILEGKRLLEVLPGILRQISAALEAAPEGRVFVHCQQGRSRAGSVAVAQLLCWNPTWTLYDAVAFLARRRPEVELNLAYAEALEEFATNELQRDPSLQLLQEKLPAQLRGAGVARDFRDKCFDVAAPSRTSP